MKLFFVMITSMLSMMSSLSATENENVTPDQALQRLREGNDRFVANALENCDKTEAKRLKTQDVQRPFAIILGCSDSRVPPEVVFDQHIGDLFVIRVAGNVAGALERESIEYSVKVNNSSLIVVLGHENCGAISAILSGNVRDINAIATIITPSIDKLKKQLNHAPTLAAAVKANVLGTLRQLQFSPVIASAIEKKQLKMVGGYYSFETGKVEFLE